MNRTHTHAPAKGTRNWWPRVATHSRSCKGKLGARTKACSRQAFPGCVCACAGPVLPAPLSSLWLRCARALPLRCAAARRRSLRPSPRSLPFPFFHSVARRRPAAPPRDHPLRSRRCRATCLACLPAGRRGAMRARARPRGRKGKRKKNLRPDKDRCPHLIIAALAFSGRARARVQARRSRRRGGWAGAAAFGGGIAGPELGISQVFQAGIRTLARARARAGYLVLLVCVYRLGEEEGDARRERASPATSPAPPSPALFSPHTSLRQGARVRKLGRW